MDHLIIQQIRIAKKVRITGIDKKIERISGVDVAFSGKSMVGCIGVFTFPELELLEYKCCRAVSKIAYIPNFLSFREAPVLVDCFKKLKKKPDLILVDGQGIAHPRAVGIASHLGVLLNMPTIGCAKSHLFGQYHTPRIKKGSFARLKHGKRNIGLVLRTKDNVNPLFISPGHRVSIDDCRKYVLAVTTKYRLPEPIRFAHRTAGEHARRLDV